jgi:hypothetical protein
MDKDRDLLPWILGGLLIATVAVAIAVHSTNRIIAPAHSQAVSQAIRGASAPTSLTPASAPAAAAPAAAAPAADVPPPAASGLQVQAVNLPPPVTAGQIWECRINGQRAFSSSPCGTESTVRPIGPINRMDSTPIPQQPRSYEAESSYRAPYPYPYPSEPQDANPTDFADNAYPVFVGIPFQEHRRPDHAHRPHGQRPRLEPDATWPPSPGPHAPKSR